VRSVVRETRRHHRTDLLGSSVDHVPVRAGLSRAAALLVQVHGSGFAHREPWRLGCGRSAMSRAALALDGSGCRPRTRHWEKHMSKGMDRKKETKKKPAKTKDEKRAAKAAKAGKKR
jgi:hypothetical protein